MKQGVLLRVAQFQAMSLLCAASAWEGGDPEWVNRGKDGRFAKNGSSGGDISVRSSELDSLSQELVSRFEKLKQNGMDLVKKRFDELVKDSKSAILSRAEKLSKEAKDGAEKVFTDVDKALSSDERYLSTKASLKSVGKNITDTAKRMQTDTGKQGVALGFLLGSAIALFAISVKFENDASPSYTALAEQVDFESLSLNEKALVRWADRYIQDLHASPLTKKKTDTVLSTTDPIIQVDDMVPLTKEEAAVVLPIADKIIQKHLKP